MGAIELPRAHDHPPAARERAPLGYAAAIGQGGRIAGEEDEDLGRVGQAEIPRRQDLEHVPGHMVDEDHHQRQAAEEIDPQIPALTSGHDPTSTTRARHMARGPNSEVW